MILNMDTQYFIEALRMWNVEHEAEGLYLMYSEMNSDQRSEVLQKAQKLKEIAKKCSR